MLENLLSSFKDNPSIRRINLIDLPCTIGYLFLLSAVIPNIKTLHELYFEPAKGTSKEGAKNFLTELRRSLKQLHPATKVAFLQKNHPVRQPMDLRDAESTSRRDDEKPDVDMERNAGLAVANKFFAVPAQKLASVSGNKRKPDRNIAPNDSKKSKVNDEKKNVTPRPPLPLMPPIQAMPASANMLSGSMFQQSRQSVTAQQTGWSSKNRKSGSM